MWRFNSVPSTDQKMKEAYLGRRSMINLAVAGIFLNESPVQYAHSLVVAPICQHDLDIDRTSGCMGRQNLEATIIQ